MALFATLQQCCVVDLQAVDTQPSDLTPWSEIDGGKATRVMEMPVGYLGRRNAALGKSEDLGRWMGFLVQKSTVDVDAENQEVRSIKSGENPVRISSGLHVE